MEPPKIFGYNRTKLTQIYETLVASEEVLPYTSLFLKTHLSYSKNKPLLKWLVEQGFIESVDYDEIRGGKAGLSRNPRRNVKGWYRITSNGRTVLNMYESLFDVMGLSGRIQERFPDRIKTKVKTNLHSGKKMRI